MSLVFIKFHNENIKDIDKTTESTTEHFRFPKYVSTHSKSVKPPAINPTDCNGKKLISNSNRFANKTFGYAETPLNEPKDFLKKKSGVKWQRLHDHVCPPKKDMPPIPKKCEMKKKIKPKPKNFIKANVRRAKTAVPQICSPKYVDTVVGDRHELEPTGLIPKYVLTKTFGKAPSYLKFITKELAEKCKILQQEPEEEDYGVHLMSNDERNTLLCGLREKHMETLKIYQVLPIFTDTTSKKLRKAKLEKELKNLEQDIALLETNPVIYICDY